MPWYMQTAAGDIPNGWDIVLVYDGLNVHARVQREGAGVVRTMHTRSKSGRWSEAEAEWGR